MMTDLKNVARAIDTAVSEEKNLPSSARAMVKELLGAPEIRDMELSYGPFETDLASIFAVSLRLNPDMRLEEALLRIKELKTNEFDTKMIPGESDYDEWRKHCR